MRKEMPSKNGLEINMKRIFIIIMACLLLLMTACGSKTPDDITNLPDSPSDTLPDASDIAYRTISPKGAKALLDNGKPLVLVDVRTAEEYAQKHIPSAILLPNEDISDSIPQQLPDLNSTIILYCRSGRRSKDAADKLIALGYTDVRDLGGINDWSYDTVSGEEIGEWVRSEDASNGILSTFTATDLYGAVADESALSDYKLTMVNVWATFCSPCVREMPDLGELAVEYESKGVQIVGMVSDVLKSNGTVDDKQLSTAKDIAEKTKANYLHIVPSPDLFPLLAEIQSVPTTFFVDENGNQVGYAYIGSRSKADWQLIIDEMLAEVEK